MDLVNSAKFKTNVLLYLSDIDATGDATAVDSDETKSHHQVIVVDSKFSNCINSPCLSGFYTRFSSLVTLVGLVLMLVIVWVILYVLMPREVLPQGTLFQLVALVIVAQVVGSVVGLINLPPLLGMLVTGIVARSFHLIHVQGVYKDIITTSRDIALTVILIKAGLGLSPTSLKKNAFLIISLAVGPCLAEALGAAVITQLIFKYPWLWNFLMGFLLSPISPAVVVPTLLQLKEKGYGEDKGIATVVVAAATLDDIFSITLFGIFLSLIFKDKHSESLALQVATAPLEIIMGLAAGVIWGFVCAFIPSRDDRWVVAKRSVLIGLGGLTLTLGSKALDFSGAGPLAVITETLVAAICWRQEKSTVNPNSFKKVQDVFSIIWVVVQPILFSLIGEMIDVTAMVWSDLALSCAIFLSAISIRVLMCILVTFGSKLNWKERLFINLAWLPKATVQAALSPLPFQKARNPEEKDRALFLLTTAVLAILVTAPLGALGISISGPRLLSRTTNTTDQQLQETDSQDHQQNP